MEHNDALNIHSDKLQTMLRANENVQKINEARQAEQQQAPVSEPIEGDEGPQVAGEATSAMHDVATVQQYIANSCVDRQGAWGTWVEMMVLANMVGANVYSYCIQNDYYEIYTPGYIDPAVYPQDYGRQSMYILYMGDHFNVVLSQEAATSV